MPEENNKPKLPTCGIIMPISLIDNLPPEHWADILGILKDVCIATNFTPNLVSDADDIGVIHNRIIENIYSSEIVICDVSCKNANVMFELGMRLAFDKPTIIIKDDLTGYSFDTSLIEHLEYPRDLRFTSIIKFKENLGKKLKATHEKAISDPNYSTFLKNFGKYKIAHLEDKEVTSDTFILNAIEDLRRDMRLLRNSSIHMSDRALIRTRSFEDLSEDEKNTFKTHVTNYINENNLSKKPRDLDLELPDMISVLEKNSELRKIAGSSMNLKDFVFKSIYS